MCLFMTILYVAFFICLPVTTKAENYYVSSHEATDWKTATIQCNLAEPELIFSSDGVHLDLSANIITDDVWIGYYIARTALEYFGCARTGSYTPVYQTKADPGQCLSACGVDKVIGISGNKCFCFNKDKIIGNGETLFPYCDETCNDLPGIVCGKSDYENGFMSLYRSIGPSQSIASIGDSLEDARCMYYKRERFVWDMCNMEHRIICEKDNVPSTTRYIKAWKDATRSCFKDMKRPSSYNNTKSVSAYVKLWTGIVRSDVIYKYTTYPILSKYAEKYVYISYNYVYGEVKADKWGRKLRTLTKKLLCLNDTTTTSSTTTTTRSLMTSTDSETSPDSIQIPSTISVIVATSVSIVVGTAILIIVIVTVCLRKRGAKETQPSHQINVGTNNENVSSASRPNQQNISNEDEHAEIEIHVATAATGDEPESDYAYENIELKKTDNTYDRTKDMRVKRGIQSALNPYSNSGCEDDQYDITEGVHQKPKANTANPYAYLCGYEEESSNYDHIGKSKKATAGRHLTADDNTYNTTNLGFLKTGAIPTENMYSVAGANETDDKYSHINAKKTHPTRSKGSENIYGTLKK